MKHLLRLSVLFAAMIVALGVSAGKHEFQTVPGDPLDTKMYTLKNGLKIFRSENTDEPLSQKYFGFRV